MKKTRREGRDLVPKQVGELVDFVIYQKEESGEFDFGEELIFTISFINTINLILKSYGIDESFDGEIPHQCIRQLYEFIYKNIEDCVLESEYQWINEEEN